MAIIDRYEARMTDNGIEIYVGVDAQSPQTTLVEGQGYDVFIDFYDTISTFLTPYSNPDNYTAIQSILTQDVYRIDIDDQGVTP